MSRNSWFIVGILSGLIVVIAAFFGINYLLNKEDSIKITIEDQCGTVIGGSVLHTLKSSDECKTQCINKCISKDKNFKKSNFVIGNATCNMCKCECN